MPANKYASGQVGMTFRLRLVRHNRGYSGAPRRFRFAWWYAMRTQSGKVAKQRLGGYLFRWLFVGRVSFPMLVYTRSRICQGPATGGSQWVTARRLWSLGIAPDAGLCTGFVGIWMLLVCLFILFMRMVVLLLDGLLLFGLSQLAVHQQRSD